MNRSCDSCGYSASDEGFFRRERGGLFGLDLTVCDGCTAYRPAAYEKGAFRNWVVSRLMWVLVALVITRSNLAEVWPVVVFMIAASLMLLPTLVVHEFGHAFFARFAGLDVISISVGSGPGMTAFTLHGVRFDIRRYVFSGGMVRFVDLRETPSKWRSGLAILGGPLANAAVALLVFGASSILSSLNAGGELAAAALAGVAFPQATVAIYNLLPFTVAIGLPSDGKRLVALMFDKPIDLDRITTTWLHGRKLLELRRYEAASETFVAAAAECPFEVTAIEVLLRAEILNSLPRARGAPAAYQHYLAHKDRFDQAQGFGEGDARFYQAFLQANIAWTILAAGEPDELPVAERLALSAFEAIPESPALKGNLGAVRIARGDVEGGLALLLDATRQTTDPFDKADFCAFLAKGERARGDMARAQGFEDLRQHILARG